MCIETSFLNQMFWFLLAQLFEYYLCFSIVKWKPKHPTMVFSQLKAIQLLQLSWDEIDNGKVWKKCIQVLGVFGTSDFVLNFFWHLGTILSYFKLRKLCKQLKLLLESWTCAAMPIGNVTYICLINARNMEVSYSDPVETFSTLKSAESNKNQITPWDAF